MFKVGNLLFKNQKKKKTKKTQKTQNPVILNLFPLDF